MIWRMTSGRMRKLELDVTGKEKIIYQDELLHYGIYRPSEGRQFYGDIPWHWHEEFEFGYVLCGEIVYRTNEHEYTLHKGDGIFINSGILHSLHPVAGEEEVKIQTQFWDKMFLAGHGGSAFDVRYIAPVMKQRQLDAVVFYEEDPKYRKALELLEKTAVISLGRERFFEFGLRNLFAEIWKEIYQRAMGRESVEDIKKSQDNERIKRILSYLRDHIGEDLPVSRLAHVIPVSERECFRLFRRCLDTSPMEYILSLRLEKALELLAYTEKSVSTVSQETGFGSSSYFGKIFKEHFHMTPKEYRRKALG